MPGKAGELLPVACSFLGSGFNVGPVDDFAHILLGTVKE
jgi:hypothetical protein